MHSLLIIHITHVIYVPHLTTKRTNYALKIHFNFHLLSLKTQRVNILVSHLALYLIYFIMRMSMESLIFIIIAIMMMTLLLLIF